MTGPAPGAHLGDLLSALVDHELDPSEDAAARVHLARCPACTAELAATEQARALVRGLPAVEPPVPLTGPVVRRPRRAAPAMAAAAAVVAFVLLAGVGEERSDLRVGRLVEVHATSVVNADPVSQLAPAAIPVSFGR